MTDPPVQPAASVERREPGEPASAAAQAPPSDHGRREVTGRAATWWADPLLNELAAELREAHRAVAALPAHDRPRLTRRLLVITDLAKRDPELAARRLRAFRAGIDDEFRR